MKERSTRFQNWFQTISNVAIIFGLGLVVYELNQSKQLAWAQMAQDHMGRQMDHQIALMGDDPRQALARAALNPAELSESDVVALQAFYEARMLSWFSVYRAGELMGEDRGWRSSVAWDARTYFGTAPGRRWLKEWTDRVVVAAEDSHEFSALSKEVAEVAKAAIGDKARNYYRSQYEMLLMKE